MNRTIASGSTVSVHERLTENKLCDEIYNNLRVLAIVCPFADELKAVFQKDMFIKSNPKAFPHVMRYLFMLCDAAEFRKKFVWPLYNKASEASFRISTMEFLGKLNLKYGLGFGQLKNQLVVFPGGYEFMKVLHEVIKLAMRLLIKKYHGSQDTSVIEAEAFVVRMEKLYELCDVQCRKIEEHSKELSLRTKRMMQVVENLTARLPFTNDMILSGMVERHCFDMQQSIVTEYIKPDLMAVKEFQRQCASLESIIDKVFEKRTITYNEGDINRFVGYMREKYPEYSQKFHKIVSNCEINVDNLFFTFELAIPMILDYVSSYQPRSMVTLKYEQRETEQLLMEASATYYNVLKLEQNINFRQEMMSAARARSPKVSHMQALILATPPMNYSAVQSSERIAVGPKRISLSENFSGKRNQPNATSKLSAIAENVVLMTPVCRSSSSANTTGSPLCMNQTIDPIQMLRSIDKKKKNRKLNRKYLSSSLAQLKWPSDDTANTMTNHLISPANEFSSTLNETIAGMDTTAMVTQPQSSIASPCYTSNQRSIRQHYTSFDDDEFNAPHMHRSPSGRIDARHNKGECDKMNIGQRPYKDHHLDKPANKPMATSSPTIYKFSSSTMPLSVEQKQLENMTDAAERDTENNMNVSNNACGPIVKPSLFQLINNDHELLLNVSDSVLNNLDMSND